MVFPPNASSSPVRDRRDFLRPCFYFSDVINVWIKEKLLEFNYMQYRINAQQYLEYLLILVGRTHVHRGKIARIQRGLRGARTSSMACEMQNALCLGKRSASKSERLLCVFLSAY